MQVVRSSRMEVHSYGDDGIDINLSVERSLSPQELGGVILGCTTATYNECLTNKNFGLPYNQIQYAERIEEGLPIFLFNFTEREMHGIFEAVNGAVDVEHSMCSNLDSKSRATFPTKVCVRPRLDWPIVSLPERVFKEAIIDNYYSYTRFYFELDHKQADELVSLFMRQTITPPRQIFTIRDAVERSSAPHSDVRVVFRENLLTEGVGIGQGYSPDGYGRCGIFSDEAAPDKHVSRNLYEWDDMPSPVSTESFCFGYRHDDDATKFLDSDKSGYIPVEDGPIKFNLDTVAGENLIEAGTFSFQRELSQVQTYSDGGGDTPKFTGDASIIEHRGHSEEFEAGDTNSSHQQDDEKTKRHHPDVCEERNCHNTEQGNNYVYSVDATGGRVCGNSLRDKFEDQPDVGGLSCSRIMDEDCKRQSSVNRLPICHSQTHAHQLSEGGKLSLRPRLIEVYAHQLDEVAGSCSADLKVEPDEHCTQQYAGSKCVPEDSIRLPNTLGLENVTAAPRFNGYHMQDQQGVDFSPASGQGTAQAARKMHSGNYGAMFSWASEVTRFLSSRDHGSRSAGRTECRHFLGKLRQLNIMRDESQAQALVQQIQALRVKPVKEEHFDFGDPYDPSNEELRTDNLTQLEVGSMQRHSSLEEQQPIHTGRPQQMKLEAYLGDLGLTSSTNSSEMQDEVQLWRSEWLKEAKWRLEDYEHMQNTMFLLENSRRFA